MLATPYCSRDARQLFPVDRVWQASQLPTRTVRDSMTDTKETLEELEPRVPGRHPVGPASHPFVSTGTSTSCTKTRESPATPTSALPTYSTTTAPRYDEGRRRRRVQAGLGGPPERRGEHLLRAGRPRGDARVRQQSEVRRSRPRTPEAYQAPARARRVGQVRLRPPGPALLRDYTTRDEGRMYTFRWTNLCDVIGDQDPADDVVRSPMNQDPIVPPATGPARPGHRGHQRGPRCTVHHPQRAGPGPGQRVLHGPPVCLLRRRPPAGAGQPRRDRSGSSPTRTSAAGSRPSNPRTRRTRTRPEATGDVNYSKIAIYGESDPRAFDYSGRVL